MDRKRIKRLLDNTTEKDLPYIFIPSYNKPYFLEYENWLNNFTPEARKKVFIVVREEQYDKYKKLSPNLQFIKIPKGAVSGVGSTRQFILDYAIKHRFACIMDMDDDIKYLEYLYTSRTKSGEPCSKHSTVSDWDEDPLIPQKVLQLAGKISRKCFEEHPEVLLGSLRKQRFSNHPSYSDTMYMINKGPTPRQTKIINVLGIYKAGIRVPDEFNLHGDDIGFAAEVLAQGFSCFNIPCLCYDYIDDQVDSSVRDPKDEEANRWLHELEYDALMNMPIKDYLRETHKFSDGAYKFGDINWSRYHKINNTSPIIKHWKHRKETQYE